MARGVDIAGADGDRLVSGGAPFDAVFSTKANIEVAQSDPSKRIHGLSGDNLRRFTQSKVLQPGQYVLAVKESSDPNLVFAADEVRVKSKVVITPL